MHRYVILAFGILHFAFTSFSTRPAAATRSQSATIVKLESDSPLNTLKAGILAAINVPGVQRGTWGIVAHSLDRNERLFELNPHTLLVPASVAKLASVASAVEAVGWDYRFETTL